MLRSSIRCLVAAVVLGCSVSDQQPEPEPEPEPDAVDADAGAAETTNAAVAPSSGPLPPASTLHEGTIESRVVIFIEASNAELDQLRDRYNEEDLAVVGDDLMFYRATAQEYLEARGYAFQRMVGRTPLRFRVSGQDRQIDFADVELLDFIVVYDTDRAPEVIPANQVELVEEYFGR